MNQAVATEKTDSSSFAFVIAPAIVALIAKLSIVAYLAATL